MSDKCLNNSSVFKKFNTEQELIETLPRDMIKLLNQFTEKHDIFLPSVIPAGYDHVDGIFDLGSCVFRGPFKGDNYSTDIMLVIE